MQATFERIHQANRWMKEHFGSEMRPVKVVSSVWEGGTWGPQEESIKNLVTILKDAATDTDCIIEERFEAMSMSEPNEYLHIVEIQRGQHKDAFSYLGGLTKINMKLFTKLQEKGIDANNPGKLEDPLDRLLVTTFNELTKTSDHLAQPLSN